MFFLFQDSYVLCIYIWTFYVHFAYPYLAMVQSKCYSVHNKWSKLRMCVNVWINFSNNNWWFYRANSTVLLLIFYFYWILRSCKNGNGLFLHTFLCFSCWNILFFLTASIFHFLSLTREAGRLKIPLRFILYNFKYLTNGAAYRNDQLFQRFHF